MVELLPSKQAVARSNRVSRSHRTIATVIAIHGNGGGAFRFARVLPYLPSQIRFRALTLPGFDGRPPDPALCSPRDYAAWIRSECQSEPRPLILLGHGIGGALALQLAHDAPAAVDSLILHAPVGARLDVRRIPRLMALPGARRAGRRLVASRLLRPYLSRLLFTRSLPQRTLRRFFTAYGRCAVFDQFFDLLTPAWFAALRPVTMPAVLLWGGRDRVLSPAHATEFGRLLPSGQVCIVPNWGHFPMIDQPETYASEISRLVRDLVGS